MLIVSTRSGPFFIRWRETEEKKRKENLSHWSDLYGPVQRNSRYLMYIGRNYCQRRKISVQSAVVVEAHLTHDYFVESIFSIPAENKRSTCLQLANSRVIVTALINIFRQRAETD